MPAAEIVTTDVTLAEVRQHRARRFMVAGGGIISIGLCVAGSFRQDFGGTIVVCGWLAMVTGLHLYGRTGTLR